MNPDTLMLIMSLVLVLSFISVCLTIYYNHSRSKVLKDIEKALPKLIEKMKEDEWENK